MSVTILLLKVLLRPYLASISRRNISQTMFSVFEHPACESVLLSFEDFSLQLINMFYFDSFIAAAVSHRPRNISSIGL